MARFNSFFEGPMNRTFFVVSICTCFVSLALPRTFAASAFSDGPAQFFNPLQNDASRKAADPVKQAPPADSPSGSVQISSSVQGQQVMAEDVAPLNAPSIM